MNKCSSLFRHVFFLVELAYDLLPEKVQLVFFVKFVYGPNSQSSNKNFWGLFCSCIFWRICHVQPCPTKAPLFSPLFCVNPKVGRRDFFRTRYQVNKTWLALTKKGVFFFMMNFLPLRMHIPFLKKKHNHNSPAVHLLLSILVCFCPAGGIRWLVADLLELLEILQNRGQGSQCVQLSISLSLEDQASSGVRTTPLWK